MQITIRSVVVEDAAEITTLSNQLGYTPTLTETAASLFRLQHNVDEIVYVALFENIVVGWIQVSHYTRLESGNTCEITGLVVDEKYRGQGIGKLLVNQAQQWSAEKGATKLRVRSNIIRTDAHRFYTDLGFEIIKQQIVFEIK